jgi:hypothetical protein
MAQGDVTVFSKAKERVGDAQLNLSAGPFFVMLSEDGGTDPTENDSDPGYNAARAQDWTAAAFESNPGGNYTAGGTQVDITITDNWTLSGNSCKFDVDDVSWTQHASNPASARWACMYLSDANDYGICFVDLGSNFNMTTGDLSITWHANGVFTLT